MSEFKTQGSDPSRSVGDLEWSQVQAILKTMAEDEHLDLTKLEIRKKQNGLWRVIISAAQK